MVSYKKKYLELKEQLDHLKKITIEVDYDLTPKEDCEHYWNYELKKYDGVVHIMWNCEKCFARLTQVVGQALSPEKLSEKEHDELREKGKVKIE